MVRPAVQHWTSTTPRESVTRKSIKARIPAGTTQEGQRIHGFLGQEHGGGEVGQQEGCSSLLLVRLLIHRDGAGSLRKAQSERKRSAYGSRTIRTLHRRSPSTRCTSHAYGTVGKPYLNTGMNNANEILNQEVTTGNQVHDEIFDMIDIWIEKRDSAQSYQHPTQKPVTLNEKPFKRCSAPLHIVFSGFAGSEAT